MKSFPQPLTASEERYYMQKYTEGDLEAKHVLIERNLRLVAHIVKKYQSMEEDTEDLLSIGTIGLIKAVVTFNPDKCVRLGTYAARCIEKPTPTSRRQTNQKGKTRTLFTSGRYTESLKRILLLYIERLQREYSMLRCII